MKKKDNERIINHGIGYGLSVQPIPFKSKEMNRSDQNRNASIGMFFLYTFIVAMIIAALTSCGSTKSCHTKGVYVSKSIKKAQSKPHAH